MFTLLHVLSGRIRRSGIAEEGYDIRNRLTRPSERKERMRIMSFKKTNDLMENKK